MLGVGLAAVAVWEALEEEYIRAAIDVLWFFVWCKNFFLQRNLDDMECLLNDIVENAHREGLKRNRD